MACAETPLVGSTGRRGNGAPGAKANGNGLDVDTAIVSAVGDSSGANLVAGLSVRDPKSPAMQLLMYPPVDLWSDTESMRTESTAALDAVGMVWSWDAYAGGADNEGIAPLRPASPWQECR